jgi:exodeoxyribonuclease VII large subunit
MSAADSAVPYPPAERVLSVAELTGVVKELLETAFPSVWVRGEISNFSRPGSGHCYFTLQDAEAQIRSVMWRSAVGKVRFPLEDGLEVICRGHLDVYAPRGSYQLVVEAIEPAGMGARELALRRLRDKLAAEGLFDPLRKRPLPAFPMRIGFVTSPTGAAVRDFLEVLKRRWPGVSVLVIPARVQGEGSAAEIVAGIVAANALVPALDVLVVGRGGGSAEDLWSFNEEIVVRAIAASRVPTISAVGHEIDITLADLVADMRALTPSEAAERIVPATEEIRGMLLNAKQRMIGALRGRVTMARNRYQALASRRVLAQPLDRIHDLARRLDELEARGQRAAGHRLSRAKSLLEMHSGKLESLSPLGVLARGYSVTQDTATGQVLRNSHGVGVGQQITSRLAQGELVSRVEEIREV